MLPGEQLQTCTRGLLAAPASVLPTIAQLSSKRPGTTPGTEFAGLHDYTANDRREVLPKLQHSTVTSTEGQDLHARTAQTLQNLTGAQ